SVGEERSEEKDRPAAKADHAASVSADLARADEAAPSSSWKARRVERVGDGLRGRADPGPRALRAAETAVAPARATRHRKHGATRRDATRSVEPFTSTAQATAPARIDDALRVDEDGSREVEIDSAECGDGRRRSRDTARGELKRASTQRLVKDEDASREAPRRDRSAARIDFADVERAVDDVDPRRRRQLEPRRAQSASDRELTPCFERRHDERSVRLDVRAAADREPIDLERASRLADRRVETTWRRLAAVDSKLSLIGLEPLDPNRARSAATKVEIASWRNDAPASRLERSRE